MKEYNVAIVGATGVVGEEMRKVLEQREFPVKELKLLASARSAGHRLTFKRAGIIVEELTKDSFKGIDIALFSAGGSVSKEFASYAVKAGAVVIDNSSAFRMDKDVPLIVPEVNPDDVKTHKGIIANPNCSTIQMVVALKPLYDKSKIKRIVVSTYQAVSGTGKEAIEELLSQSKKIILGENEIEADVYPHQIAFNLLPQIDVFLKNDYTKEEMKMVNETQKIMGDPNIGISATCVRVPILISHSEAVNIETEKKISSSEAKEILKNAPGVEVIDEPKNCVYPMPIFAVGKDACYVGRIREDESIKNGLNLWIVSDNLRKGAALNAVQIAEILVKRKLL
ncbi:aspartate-semialdehyde dehydrogenase [Candidatus Oleimmundimicrobium sp.]|uniref:aspartate-semialdehyde dehydrogenase n=1 Tax=Candidatus Oleimmundimicrobium sp. TaxID=3060597 RepID=UPI002723DA86|nr:aspartate-semialdehyde dehydrogenase [Candidatus Oleimmundimicrobium sp.]MDO8886240.1 aspartate-semialdehyde dehydrogenase [Candidatus Oleimmundimicrobium sp.]